MTSKELKRNGITYNVPCHMDSTIEGYGNTETEAKRMLSIKRETLKQISGIVSFGEVATYGDCNIGFKCVQSYRF